MPLKASAPFGACATTRDFVNLVPFLSTQTPPTGFGLSSLPNPATNTCPAPNANVVGVGTPRATTVTAWPPTAFGGGGGPFAAKAVETSTKAPATPTPAADLRRIILSPSPRLELPARPSLQRPALPPGEGA